MGLERSAGRGPAAPIAGNVTAVPAAGRLCGRPGASGEGARVPQGQSVMCVWATWPIDPRVWVTRPDHIGPAGDKAGTPPDLAGSQITTCRDRGPKSDAGSPQRRVYVPAGQNAPHRHQGNETRQGRPPAAPPLPAFHPSGEMPGWVPSIFLRLFPYVRFSSNSYTKVFGIIKSSRSCVRNIPDMSDMSGIRSTVAGRGAAPTVA